MCDGNITPEVEAAIEAPLKFEPMQYDPSEDDDYTILTALRGPDYGRDDSQQERDSVQLLKLQTTAVLRHFLGVQQDVGAYVRTPEYAERDWLAERPEIRALTKERWKEQEHFRNHIHYAFLKLTYKMNRADNGSYHINGRRGSAVWEAYQEIRKRLAP